MANESEAKLLEEIRDLLVLELRSAGVSSDAIGRVLGVTAKSVRNQYPIGKVKGESSEEARSPETKSPETA